MPLPIRRILYPRQRRHFTTGRHRWATAHNILKRRGCLRHCNYAHRNRRGEEVKHYDYGVRMYLNSGMPYALTIPAADGDIQVLIDKYGRVMADIIP